MRFLLLSLAVLIGMVSLNTISAQENNAPPAGFTAIFNGRDLSGWHGMEHFDPRKLAAMPDTERKAKLEADTADAKAHWSVENGELVNDGQGAYLTTDRDYGDFELWIDYKTVAKADSGIYLRANPQVQIWDFTEAGGKWNIGADKGSGGLWNNSPGAPGKDPSELVDKPFGQWNRFRIVQVGARTSVWLNGKQVVKHAIMENFWDRSRPHFATGPIQLQTHGGEIRWKNIFLREIPADEANRILAADGGEGFTQIFNGKDFTGWSGPVENYEVHDGVLMCKPEKGGTIYTNDEYADFVARLEFKLPPGGNNGLAIRYPGQGDTAYVGMCELQVLDTEHPKYKNLDPRQAHGSAYGMIAAHRGYLRPTGEWNFQEVTVKGSTLKVELNGSVILDGDLAKVTEFMANSPHPGKDRTSGHFGFAGHSDPVQFRNVSIKRLSSSDKSAAAAQVEKAELGSTVNVHRCGTIYLAGQPGRDDLAKLKEQGVAMVIDLRTDGEIDWDEGAAVKGQGIDYAKLAFRGADSLTDDILNKTRELLCVAVKENRKIVVHCGSANRVGAVWLAHRVLDDGLSWEAAAAEAEEVGLRTPAYSERVKSYVAAKQAK